MHCHHKDCFHLCHQPTPTPGFLVLLYLLAMGVLVVMRRKQKRDRLLRWDPEASFVPCLC